MSLRKLLLITYHFPPSAAAASYRLLGFARHLPKFGWRADVLAPPRMPFEPVDEQLARQIPPETTVHAVNYPNGILARGIRRYVAEAIWLPPALMTLRRVIRDRRPDAVLTSGPQHWVHLLGLHARRRLEIPWIADFRDPWIASTKAANSRSWWVRWQAKWERTVVHYADLVLANAPQAQAGLHVAFPKARNKIQCLTNGFNPEDFAPQPLRPLNGRLSILHAGELYTGRDPRPFLDALRDVEANRPAGQKPLRFTLLGRATENSFNLADEVRQRGLDPLVEVGGQVPYQRALQRMCNADILLLVDSPGRRIGVPAKLYEYLGAQRPILALAEAESDVAWVLRESGVPHRVAPLHDAVRIRQALQELVRDLCEERLQPAPPHRLEAFTRESLTGTLANLLNEIVPPQQPVVEHLTPELVGGASATG